MLLNLSDMSSEPLYEQIVRQVRAQVLSGNLEPGIPLPSIRDLARTTNVSVITVQKAYDALARDKILIARRGKGYFVANLPGSGKIDMARTRCAESLRKPIDDAFHEGLGARDIRKILEELIAESAVETSKRSRKR